MTTKAQRIIKTPSERDCDEFVRREVLLCLSSVVSTLAMGAHAVTQNTDMGKNLNELCELAMELSAPVDDWEEAAGQLGLELNPNDAKLATWEGVCVAHNVDPYQWEVFEHWAVTPYFADKLQEHGEKVERDFMGLNVWARTCTGQGIASDGVIQRIVKEAMNA